MSEADRIARIEERLCWLERHVLEQDKAMLEMSDILERTRRELRRLQEGQATAHRPEGDVAADEKPPHY